jgi:hypothetical protein
MTPEEVADAVRMIRGVAKAANDDAETLDRLATALADLVANPERENLTLKAKTLGGEFMALELAKGIDGAKTEAVAHISAQIAEIVARYGAGV